MNTIDLEGDEDGRSYEDFCYYWSWLDENQNETKDNIEDLPIQHRRINAVEHLRCCVIFWLHGNLRVFP